jgi:hypothetical protein
MLKLAFGDETVSKTQKLVLQVTKVEGNPSMTRTDKSVAQHVNRCVTICDLANEVVGVSLGPCQSILTQDLNMPHATICTLSVD